MNRKPREREIARLNKYPMAELFAGRNSWIHKESIMHKKAEPAKGE